MTVEPLKTACLQHMKVYFETTVATDLFLRLPADQLLTLLQADDLQVDSEEKAFQAIVRWVSPEGKRDGDRAEYLPQLLREVRWRETNPQFRRQLIEHDSVVGENVEHLWHILPSMREKRVAMAAVALQDGRVFCFGGFDGTSRLSTVEFCCLQRSWRETKSVGAAITDEFWKAAAPMRSARSKLAGAYFRGKIIIIGGYNRKGGLNSVDMFSLPDADRPLGEWTGLSDMQQPRHLCFLLVCNERLFALGGEEDSQNTIEEFSSEDPLPPVDSDLTTWTWIENRRASKLNGIRGAATVIL